MAILKQFGILFVLGCIGQCGNCHVHDRVYSLSRATVSETVSRNTGKSAAIVDFNASARTTVFNSTGNQHSGRNWLCLSCWIKLPFN